METRGQKRERLALESGVDRNEHGPSRVRTRRALAAAAGGRRKDSARGEAGRRAEADQDAVPRQPSPGEQVLFCKLLRDGILKHFNPYKLRDLQCILELRCFKGVLSDEDLRYCFESVWGFGGYDFEDAPLGCIPCVVCGKAVDAVGVLLVVQRMQSDPEFSIDWSHGCRLFVYACRGGLSTSVVRLLIERLRDISRPSHEVNDALSEGVREAAKGGHAFLIDLLVEEYGAEIDDECLCDALEFRQVDTARHLLLKYCVSVKAKSRVGATPLHVAAKGGLMDSVCLLLEHSADVNSKDGSGQTALHYAARGHCCIHVSRLLVGHGADVNARDFCGHTPLHVAALSSFRSPIDVVRLLLEHGADVNVENKDGDTPLHVAVWEKTGIDFVRLLLELSADVHSKGRNGDTPLLYALRWGAGIDVVRLLLQHGADVHAEGRNGDSPLYHTLWCGAGIDVVGLLLEHGADVNAKNDGGDTPLYVAVREKRDIDIARVLLEHGADVNAMDEDGETPLHYAFSEKTDISFVRLLLQHGADVNAKDEDGETPLHVASRYDGIDIARLTALQLAESNNNHDCAKLIRQAMKSRMKVDQISNSPTNGPG